MLHGNYEKFLEAFRISEQDFQEMCVDDALFELRNTVEMNPTALGHVTSKTQIKKLMCEYISTHIRNLFDISCEDCVETFMRRAYEDLETFPETSVNELVEMLIEKNQEED